MDANDLLRALRKVVDAFRTRQFNLLLAMAVGGIFFGVLWLPGLLAKGITIPHFQAIFWIGTGLGIALFAWLCLRIVRLALPPELPKRAPVPTSLKGLSAFSQAEGARFRNLGRTQEIEVLLGLALDDQVPLAVLRGESGAGKTSLLRAGLQFTLEESRGIPCVYWEARAGSPLEGFRHALSVRLGTQVSRDLSDLPALVNTSTVVILDQFEQLRQEAPEHRPIFDFIERLIKGPPPYRLKLVVAFRQENYDTRWLNFEEQIQTQARKISLKLFRPDVAEGVMATILGDANLEVQRALLRNYFYAVATPGGGISPVDLGIGALVLDNWAQQRSREQLNLDDYIRAGGAAGILTTHVNECLNELPAFDRAGVIKGVTLALIDVPRDQRIAAGATCEEIAAKGQIDAGRLISYVKNRLAGPNARILEGADDEDATEKRRYRLTHERLVPVFRQLAGETLAEVDRAKLVFDDHYARWLRSRSRSFLISGKDLRLALQYTDLILAGGEGPGRADFLAQSRGRRNWKRAAMAGFALVFLAISVVGWQQLNRFVAHKQLMSWRLPPELYERQQRLKELEFKLTRVNDLHWLRSSRLRELSVYLGRIDLIEPIAKLSGLQSLTLELSGSPVTSLADLAQLKELRNLTLDLMDSRVARLADLTQLQGIENLTLNLNRSRITSLADLAQLKRLKNLTIYLEGSNIPSLADLTQLQRLESLALDLGGTKFTSLADLAQMKGLKNLTLNLGRSNVATLADLSQLPALESLTLDLGQSDLKLQDLAQANGQLSLSLEVGEFGTIPWTDLAQLRQLRNFNLHLPYSKLTMLPELAQLQGLQSLTLNLSSSKITTLANLTQLKGLQNLKLVLGGTQFTTLADLAEVKGLRSLTLDLVQSRIDTLADLNQMQALQNLTLDLRFSSITSLADLARLQGLRSLSLDLRYSHIPSLADLAQIKSLQSLTADLRDSRVVTFSDLAQLTGPSLTLTVSGYQVSKLGALRSLSSLKSLTVIGEGNTFKDVPESVESLHLLDRYE